MYPLKKLLRTVVISALLAGAAGSATAQGLIRDAEIEHTLKTLARPIFQQAGLSPTSVNIYVVDNRDLNAFVAGGRNIFINSGLISRLKTPEMLQAVIAHETGHITGGHQITRALKIGSANTAAGLGVLLAIAASAAGGQKGASGLLIGAQSAAQRSIFAHTRSEEASADQSGSRYMARAGIDPQAAVDVLDIFKGQEALSISRQDAYALSHPLSSQRINNLKSQVAAFRGKPVKDDPNARYWHARMVAKFNGFTRAPGYNLRRLADSDKGEIATLTRAIAYHRTPKHDKALAQMKRLIAMRPKDPYYHELKGQILLEHGNADKAAQAYHKAVSLLPKHPLLLSGLGRALLATKTKQNHAKALKVLEKSRALDGRDRRMLRDLALAYARAGKKGMASVVTAERSALGGNFAEAELHATRATGFLARGSAGWLRAQDIIGTAQAGKRNNKKK